MNLPLNTSVSEGAPVQTSIAQVRAQDTDSGRNAILTYNITAGNPDGAFYINETVRNGIGGGWGGRLDCSWKEEFLFGLSVHLA